MTDEHITEHREEWSIGQTKQHIGEVRGAMLSFVNNISERALVHDASKLFEPEASAFARVTHKLKTITYGSDEYKSTVKELGPALNHHYKNNSHHPEYYEHGINDMTLLDIIEMFCDWRAAGMRHSDGDMKRSIEINAERFGITTQLSGILFNTARDLDWVRKSEKTP